MKIPSRKTQRRLLRWGSLIAFLYIIMHTFSAPIPLAPAPQNPSNPAPQKTADCADNAKIVQDQISFFAIPIMPSFTPALDVQDLETGKGEMAHCGQHLELRYSYTSKSGSTIFSNLDSKTSTHVTLGDGTLLRGLELGLDGMQVGGTRRITFAPAYGFRSLEQMSKLQDNKQFAWKEKTPLGNQDIIAKATLLAVTPAAPVSAMPERIMNMHIGSGDEVFCGNTVNVNITVWSIAGQELFSTQKSGPLAVTLGQSQLPYGIEEAIYGMRIGTDRIAIIPPAFQKVLEPTKTPALVSLEGKDTVLVEISVLSTIQPAATPQK